MVALFRSPLLLGLLARAALSAPSRIANVTLLANVSTLAGDGTPGTVNGVGPAARFFGPVGVALSPDGSKLYVADALSHVIRVVTTLDGVVTTLAGSGTAAEQDGLGVLASFNLPVGVAVSPDGLKLYVTDNGGNTLRVVLTANGDVTTLAGSGANADVDGFGLNAKFSRPAGVAVSPDGTKVYIVESGGNKLRVVATATGQVSTIAGSTAGELDGLGTSAQFNSPRGVAVSPDGLKLYIVDFTGQRVRYVTVADGYVYTLAGRTPGEFTSPAGVAVSPDGALLYVTDNGGNTLRVVTTANGNVTTLAGNGAAAEIDGVGANAAFKGPYGVAVSSDGKRLWVADNAGNTIRGIVLSSPPPGTPCNASVTSGTIASALVGVGGFSPDEPTPLLVLSSTYAPNTYGVEIVVATDIMCDKWTAFGSSLSCSPSPTYVFEGTVYYYVGSAAALNMSATGACPIIAE